MIIKKLLASLLLTIFFVCPVQSSEISVQQDIENLDSEIALLDSEISKYEGGLIKNLLETQKQTLLLSKRLLEAVQRAKENGTKVEFSLKLTPIDEDRASKILIEIQNQQKVIDKTLEEVANAGGLIKALALSRLQTEKLTMAQLKLGYYQSAYGLPIQTLQGASIATKPVEENKSNEEEKVKADVEWADDAFPDIDYSNAFAKAHAELGFEFSGYWAYKIEKSSVDDSKTIDIRNISEKVTKGLDKTGMLQIYCGDNVFNFAHFFLKEYFIGIGYKDKMLVTTRVGSNKAVENKMWTMASTNDGVIRSGKKNANLFQAMREEEKFFIRIIDVYSKKETAYDIRGFKKVLDIMAPICKIDVVSLKKADYQNLQIALSAKGYEVGKPDGVFGKGSRKALKKFQTDNGLDGTGFLNSDTLSLIGLN